MTFDSLVASAVEMAALKKSGGDWQSHVGLKNARILKHLFGLAAELEALCGEKERELLLVELWPLICEAARNGDKSQLADAVRLIMAS